MTCHKKERLCSSFHLNILSFFQVSTCVSIPTDILRAPFIYVTLFELEFQSRYIQGFLILSLPLVYEVQNSLVLARLAYLNTQSSSLKTPNFDLLGNFFPVKGESREKT